MGRTDALRDFLEPAVFSHRTGWSQFNDRWGDSCLRRRPNGIRNT